ncbi:kinesin-like protein KIF18A [Hypanus sabinus]|uniref:kinesin-like protein KIF18A n=1 Tax=Hypanus sabinus TaxID=79690 RepID=UPI0028C4832F|nr:kinesin-like protein KIF18A [Hypanus sabinus]
MPQKEEGNVNVSVVVRIRPLNHRELDSENHVVTQMVDENVLVFDPKEEINDDVFSEAKFRRVRDATCRKRKDLKFVFDRVFNENSTQQEVFEFTTKHILEGVLNGYNCSVFAYGATGSGKTHTMLGSEDQPGVMYLTMLELYERIEQMKDEKICEVAVSYLEVYNEQIHDLLEPKGSLAVREDPQKGTVVQRLSFHQPKTAKELLEMLANGNQNRTQHPTDVNATSSRSHAVFQVYVKQQDRIASISKNLRVAKMCLIDLAGSERVTATKAQGARFREGANINRSLLALGNVINALADGKGKKSHIPYRDSKLTRLLKDSLGGNCQTVMIATVSPSSSSYEDTYNTLKYANRAKDIKSSLKSNIVSLDCHISKYAAICEELRREVTQLKDKLKAYEEGKYAITRSDPSTVQPMLSSQQQGLEAALRNAFANRQLIQKNYFELETRSKEMELKTFFRLRDQERIKILCTEQQLEQASCKFERSQAASSRRRDHLLEKMQQVEEKLKENGNLISQLGSKIGSDGKTTSFPQILKLSMQNLMLKAEVSNSKQHGDYVTRLMTLQDRDSRQTEKLVTTLLQVARKQFDMLREANLATEDTVSQFSELERLVRGEKAVLWADQISPEESKANQHSEVTALATFSKLHLLPENLFESTVPCMIKASASESAAQIPSEAGAKKRLPTKRCLAELGPLPSLLQKEESMRLKRRRTEIEVRQDVPSVSELRKKPSSSRIDQVNIVPKTHIKETQPLSNRSNTLGNEGSKFGPSAENTKRIFTPTISRKPKTPASTTPSSCNLFMSSNHDLNETFETPRVGDLDSTIVLGPSSAQKPKVTMHHDIMTQTNSTFLQRLGLTRFTGKSQPQALFIARNSSVAVSRSATKAHSRTTGQREKRYSSGSLSRMGGQRNQNKSRKSPVCKKQFTSGSHKTKKLSRTSLKTQCAERKKTNNVKNKSKQITFRTEVRESESTATMSVITAAESGAHQLQGTDSVQCRAPSSSPRFCLGKRSGTSGKVPVIQSFEFLSQSGVKDSQQDLLPEQRTSEIIKQSE